MSAARKPGSPTRMPATVLVVDDEPDIRRLLAEILEDEHYQVITAENAAQAREALHANHPDAVLLDIWMPDTDGITLLREWSETGALDAPVIMLSGHGTVETAVEATRLGAYDFIEKPVSMGKLLVTVGRAIETGKLKRENVSLRSQAEPISFLTGKSKLLAELRAAIEQVAASDAWVLVTGEPGSGKAVASRYLHAHSARRERPLIETSLSALPAADIALRLYGEERNNQVTPGAFELAQGGTLVLNEIGGLDDATQAQLATVLAERSYRRAGGRAPLPLDVRIIATSTDDLARAVAEGRFREDLYYRLSVVPLAMPPLRKHREDVPELVGFYVDWMVDHERLPYRKFTIGALNVLRQHDWPGNIRELRNLVQRLLILNRGPEISEAEVRQALGETPPTQTASPPRSLFERPLKQAREDFERAYLEHHLERTRGNVAELARLTGMERTHLYRKLKQLGLHPKDLKD